MNLYNQQLKLSRGDVRQKKEKEKTNTIQSCK